jgi:predicted ATPase with chaperone activity
LDELTEFKRDVLEFLRQPLEDGYVTISRTRQSVMFPAQFTLVASTNPVLVATLAMQFKLVRVLLGSANNTGRSSLVL